MELKTIVLPILSNLIASTSLGEKTPKMLSNPWFQRFMVLNDCYQLKDANRISIAASLIKRAQITNESDALFNILLENHYIDIITAIKESETPQDDAYFLNLVKVITKHGNEIGVARTKKFVAQLLGVTASRMTEWGEDKKKVPIYIQKEAEYLLNIPVWYLTSQRRS